MKKSLDIFILCSIFFLFISPSTTQAAWLSSRRSCRLRDTLYDVIYHPDSQTVERLVPFDDDDDAIVNNNENVSLAYKAKLCECGSQISYCLVLNDENYCSASFFGSDQTATCFHRAPLYSVIQMFWGPLYFSFLILFLAMFTTDCGKNARNYMLSKCFPCFNRRLIGRIISREARARDEMRRVLREAQSRPDGMREQMSLQLKTKTLCASNHEDADATAGGGEVICSICMVPLENGERVGDLDCGHHFHVECLKTWVLWRNVCPLCNAKNIAKTKVTLVEASSSSC